MENLDVVVVGAGLSGIGAACHLERRCPWASYAVLEARGSVGGTWDLFRYPGVRSDSDMFTLGYSFRPWEEERAIADGASILRYIRDTAEEHGLGERIRLHHRVVKADWSSLAALWHLLVERGDTGELVEIGCRFLFCCTGYYRYENGHVPDIPGAERFNGAVVHPQHWPGDLDSTGRNVVVIGSGATAITLVPALATQAAHVTMLQRSPTYIVSLPAEDPLASALRRLLPERIARPVVRWMKALLMEGSYQLARRRPALARRLLRKQVERQLPAGYDVETHFAPRYDPWDQRLCVVPDGDLFKAISAGKASVVTDRIATFTETGLELESGRKLQADIVVTATGLELLFLGGMQVALDGEAIDPAKRLVYKGMMLEGVPNLAIAVGYTNASWTLKCELTCDYVTRLLVHMRDRGWRQCVALNTDPGVVDEPLLGLQSGYVLRALDRLPKQGSKFPWRVHQSYLRDYGAMKLSRVEDGRMVFSNPGSFTLPNLTRGSAATISARSAWSQQ